MLLVTQRAPPIPAGRQATPPSGPVFTIDVEAATLLDANAEARTIWGADPDLLVLPTPLDRAMPGLQRLREMASTPPPVELSSEVLIMWTARGVRRLSCH